MAQYLRLWVANQGHEDYTDTYLRAAGGSPRELYLPATEEGWKRFRELREAVAVAGHGDESDVDFYREPEDDPPDLVAYLETEDENGRLDPPEPYEFLLQITLSRTEETLADFLRALDRQQEREAEAVSDL